MKNSNHSVFHPLTWVLGLILVSASLETWGQNLDLTIPSLEMPSTLVLDSKDKQEIMMGWTCCWDKKHIDSVHLEHSLKSIGLQLKENPNPLQYTPSELPSTFDWSVFYSLQLLDIYTTYRGLKYDCVREMNVIVGESPSVGKMFAVKTAILVPAIETDRRNNELTSDTFDYMNFLMSLVIANNIQQVSDAKKYCNKR
jgi:hypothetical protein